MPYAPSAGGPEATGHLLTRALSNEYQTLGSNVAFQALLPGRDLCRTSGCSGLGFLDCQGLYQTLGSNVAIQALFADEIRVVRAAAVDLAFLTVTLK
jgi:hypothetical protein